MSCRNYSIDTVKGFLILCVIIGHVLLGSLEQNVFRYVIYSFHMKNTEEFVIDYYRDLGAEISHKLVYKFPIPKIYDFHSDDSRDVKVIVLRIENFKDDF